MATGAINLVVVGVTATAAITQYRATTLAGAAATAAGNSLGISNSDGAIADRVPVAVLGTAIATAGAAVAAGAALEVGTAGKLVTKSAGITVARALSAATADGDLIEVMLIPN